MQVPGKHNMVRLQFIAVLKLMLVAGLHMEPPRRYVAPALLDTRAVVEETRSVAPDVVPDFSAIADVTEKKTSFFDFLQPYINTENARIKRLRAKLLAVVAKIKDSTPLDYVETQFLQDLSLTYEVETDDLESPGFLATLVRRVDVIPPSLVLAQAANESAWGTSRFAIEGYNFFGQWCYTEGCGLVPQRRRASAFHEVKSFSSIQDSVNAYFMNLNTFPSYQELRSIRQELREREKPIDGISLAEGLSKYSERGEDYINELRSMIYYNALLERDREDHSEIPGLNQGTEYQ